MSTSHQHGPQCGHQTVPHGNHLDYLNEQGLLECAEGVHAIAVSEKNPDRCKPTTSTHQHGPGCGHEKVMHGDHVDYLVDGRLEHPHDGHNDDHGRIG